MPVNQTKYKSLENKHKNDEVRKHLATAMATLKILPMEVGDRPAKLKAAWPAYNQISMMSAGGERRPIRLKATPKQVSHMYYWLDAAMNIDEDWRRVVLARACRIPWRRLEEIDGRSHTTLRKIENSALATLALHLEAIGHDGGSQKTNQKNATP